MDRVFQYRISGFLRVANGPFKYRDILILFEAFQLFGQREHFSQILRFFIYCATFFVLLSKLSIILHCFLVSQSQFET